MKIKETVDKAYGHIPKETTSMFSFEPPFRGIKYYWLRLVRLITR